MRSWIGPRRGNWRNWSVVSMRVGANSVAVITGAAHGIGRALAVALSARGATLALLDNDVEALASTASAVPNCTSHVCNVADADAILEVSREIVGSHGGVDILVNNAGISVAGAVEEVSIEEFRRAMEVNFWGAVHCTRAFLLHLRAAAKQNGAAAICNVLSDFALVSLPTKAAYATSKYAARALTEALQAEMYEANITVTAAYVGATATDLVLRGYAVDRLKQRQEHEFLATRMSPVHVASAIVRGIEGGRSRLIIGADARLVDTASRLSPNLVRFAMQRLWRRIPFF